MLVDRTVVQRRVLCVLARMTTMVERDADWAESFAAILEEGLTELREGDVFGTEGQSDPRGDMRDHEWSMKRVQGVDQ